MSVVGPAGTTKAYYVKVEKGTSWDNVEVESRALTYLREVFAPHAPRLSIPRLVAIFPEYRCLVTEEAKGVTLQSLLLRMYNPLQCGRKDQRFMLEAYIDSLVDILGILQSIDVNGEKAVDLEETSREITWRLSFCQERGLLSPTLKKQIEKAYCRCAAEVQGIKFKQFPAHVDFGPHNVLIHREHVCVVDWGMFGYRPTHVDVCNMWLNLWAICTYHPFGTGALNRIYDLFLARAREKLAFDDRGFDFSGLNVLVGRMYFGLKGYHTESDNIWQRLISLLRAYCYRHMLLFALKNNYFHMREDA
jgi:aminoglycoside phosphotransferase (APT) family kinase protein